jgi:hypothetical protein
MWTNARAHDEQEYIFGIDFWPNNRKKIKLTNFENFLNFFGFYEFSEFAAKIVRPISSQGNDSDCWVFSPQIQLSKLYKIGYVSVDLETLVFFFWEKLHGIDHQE